jgi:hypothetical protein
MKRLVGLGRLISLLSLLALAACSGSGQPPAVNPAAPSTPAGGPAASPPPAGPATSYPVLPALPAATPAVVGYPSEPLATPPSPATGYPAASTQPSADLQAVGRQAAAELAKKLAVDVAQIQVTSTEATDWADASLGCPQAGMVYAQVITPGYKVRLTYHQTVYEYHADQKGSLVLCQPK